MNTELISLYTIYTCICDVYERTIMDSVFGWMLVVDLILPHMPAIHTNEPYFNQKFAA